MRPILAGVLAMLVTAALIRSERLQALQYVPPPGGITLERRELPGATDPVLCSEGWFLEWEIDWARSWLDRVEANLAAIEPIERPPPEPDVAFEGVVLAALRNANAGHLIGIDCRSEDCMFAIAALPSDPVRLPLSLQGAGLEVSLITTGAFDAQGASRGKMVPSQGVYRIYRVNPEHSDLSDQGSSDQRVLDLVWTMKAGYDSAASGATVWP